ncbi:hypothetical protein B0H13DRAFT_2337820 [Mycena leptocephala]|nr:hypothetical protein B0H13DRAFT_2337820 [Mycena leptocephala]
MTTVSITGKNLPLDANFDNAAWRKPPTELHIPDDMGLQERNAHNCQVEAHNYASIQTTRRYELDVQNGPAPDATRDDEMGLMIASDDYCNKVVAPVPPIVFGFIVKERIRIAKEKEDAKEKGPELLGSMVMSKGVGLGRDRNGTIFSPSLVFCNTNRIFSHYWERN